MHSVKGVHSQTHDKNASESKVNDQVHEDLFGLALESAKCAVPKKKPLFPKSFKKSDHFKTAKSASAQLKLLSKKAEKRKELSKVGIYYEGKTVNKDSNLSSDDSYESKKVDPKSIIGKQSDTFICKYCCERFQSRELLNTHVIHHGSNPSYVCYVCGFEAQAFSSLMSHCVKHSREKNNQNLPKQDMRNIDEKIEVNSQSDSAISCSHCKVTFLSTEKLASHFCSKTEKSEYNCTYCGHSSTSVNEYRLHVISHSSNSMNPYYCLHCNFRGLTKKMLDKHYEVCKKRPKNADGSVFRCKTCKSEFKHRKLLNRHLKTCDGNPVANEDWKSCSKCNAQLNNDADYEEHILVCEANDLEHSPPSQNSEPIKKALPKSKPPKASKGKAESVLCTRCGEFLDKRGYERHRQACMKRNSSINENAVVLCPTCGDIFHTTDLEEHLKSCQQSLPADESGDELRVDEDGDSPTRRSSRLVRRKSSLSDDNSEGKKKRMKKKHFKNHSLKVIVMKGRQSKVGKEIFKCVHCDLTFCSKSTLLRHKRMHSGNPYFSCKFCGKFFFRKDVYTRHEVNVHSKTSKTTFCCYYCKFYFGASGALREHVFATHKSNAFLPIKPDLSENNTQETHSLTLEIKKEPGNDSNVLDENRVGKKLNSKKEKVKNFSKSDNPGSLVMSALKKCGSCMETFFTEEEIEKHVLTHKTEEPPISPDSEQTAVTLDNQIKSNRVSSSKRTNELRDKISLDVPPIKRRRGKLTTPKSSKSPVTQPKHSILYGTSSASINEPNILNSTVSDPGLHTVDSDNPSNTRLSEFDSDLMDITPTTIEESVDDGFTCKLCSNVFNSKPLLKSHEDTMHKIMDWYKCLVCDTFGPKLEMMEHMFSHMFKVGTFVTNSDRKSLDSLIPSLLNQDIKLSGVLNNSQHQENEVPVSDHDTADEDMDFELPHLTDHGTADCLPQLEDELVLSSCKRSRINKRIKAKPSANHSPKNIDDSSNFSVDESNSQCDQREEKSPALSTTDSNAPTVTNLEENSKSVNSSKEISNDSLLHKETVLPVKDTQDKSDPLDDPSENNKFSQLRYLLENFKKISPDSKEVPSKEANKANPDEKEKSNYAQLRHLLKSIPLNSLRNIKNNLNQLNFSQNPKQSANVVNESSTSCDYSKEMYLPTPVESMSSSHAENSKTQELNPKTCLRSDVNQYRGEVREACPSLRAELESPLGMQGKVFDLSELLLGDSNTSYEDYFKSEGTLPSDQKLNQFSSALGSPQVSKSTESNRGVNKAMNHPPTSDFSPDSPMTIHESKNTVPYSFVTEDTPEADLLSKTFKSRHLPKFFNSNYLCSVCDKPLRNGDELKLHYQNEHSSTLPNNVCKNCYQTFSNSIECVRHLSNCTKSHYRKNHLVDNNPKLPVTLQSLLADDPSRPQSYSPASPDYESSAHDVLFNTSVLNLSHNQFNS